MVNKRGITRTVYIFKTFVVKFPTTRYGTRFFVEGMLANLKEAKMWQYCYSRHLLCPVYYCAFMGLFSIMKRAEPCTVPINYELYKDFGGDDKDDNYGIIDKRIVKLDYQ